MTQRKRVDPVRNLLEFFQDHSADSAKQVCPQLDTGEVLLLNDPNDGLVVQLDNMTVPASDCIQMDNLSLSVGDRVLVLVSREEFFVISSYHSP